MSRGARDMGITCRQTVGQEWHQSSTKSEQHPLCTTPARAWETQPRHSPMESRDTNHAFEAPCPIPLPLLCNMVEAAAAAWDAFQAGALSDSLSRQLRRKKKAWKDMGKIMHHRQCMVKPTPFLSGQACFIIPPPTHCFPSASSARTLRFQTHFYFTKSVQNNPLRLITVLLTLLKRLIFPDRPGFKELQNGDK